MDSLALRGAIVAAVIAVLVLPASAAQAAPWLGYGEAARVIGRNLHRTFEYGAVSGSLYTDCSRQRSNKVRCAISFEDLDGD